METKLFNITLEGTHNREFMGGFCEPGKAFRRFYLERRGPWLEYKNPNLRASTCSAYEGHILNHFNDLDNLRINRISKVDLGPGMLTDLKKWKLACPKSKLNLIFPNKLGSPINHNNLVNRYFKPALEAAKLSKIRFHDLRHTYASLLIEQEKNIKYIQNQLGHSSPTVTLNVYAHLMKPINQEAAIRLENAIF